MKRIGILLMAAALGLPMMAQEEAVCDSCKKEKPAACCEKTQVVPECPEGGEPCCPEGEKKGQGVMPQGPEGGQPGGPQFGGPEGGQPGQPGGEQLPMLGGEGCGPAPVCSECAQHKQQPYKRQGKQRGEKKQKASRFKIGGYGEMLATFMDYGKNRFYGGNGNTKVDHNEVSIPRFVLSGEYKITDKWILGAEIEFESGGTGTTYELEESSGAENGEYETEIEKGGEVALEQFHLTRIIVPEFNVRVGHLVLPVGMVNTYHEPLNFFTAERPEGATVIMPSTWHETGLEFFGTFGKNIATFSYQAMITAGLNPNGFDVYNWVQGGSQGIFESDNFSAPAYTVRLNWTGVEGLRVGASLFYNPKAGKNADRLVTYDGLDDINIFMYSFDAQYAHKYFTLRGNFLTGYVSETTGITTINKSYTSKSSYSRMGPVAERALDWSVEAGVHVKSFFPSVKGFPDITPFVHYNYYNTQEKVTASTADDRCQVSLWSFGLNWTPIKGVVVKADYTTRQIGTAKMFGTSNKYNSENEFRLALAYSLWFEK